MSDVAQQTRAATLILGPAERADVIVDFSSYAGKTLILYNDAPTAFPALDPHYDYYTGAPDRTDIGGAPSIRPGVGPNIRTVMQIMVAGSGGTAPRDDYNPATLSSAGRCVPIDRRGRRASSRRGRSRSSWGRAPTIPPTTTTFPTTWPNWGISRISDTAISFQTSGWYAGEQFRNEAEGHP